MLALRFLDGERFIRPRGIGENSQAHDFPAEPFDVLGSVGLLHGKEDEQAGANRALGVTINGDAGVGNPLDDWRACGMELAQMGRFGNQPLAPSPRPSPPMRREGENGRPITALREQASRRAQYPVDIIRVADEVQSFFDADA